MSHVCLRGYSLMNRNKTLSLHCQHAATLVMYLYAQSSLGNSPFMLVMLKDRTKHSSITYLLGYKKSSWPVVKWRRKLKPLSKPTQKLLGNMKLPKGERRDIIFCLSHAEYFLRFFNFTYLRLNMVEIFLMAMKILQIVPLWVLVNPQPGTIVTIWKLLRALCGKSEIVFPPSLADTQIWRPPRNGMPLHNSDRFKW